MTDSEFLTVDQVAKRLRVNKQTVYNWIDRGELRGLRVGSRRIRVYDTDLQEFLAASPTRSTGPLPKLSAEARRPADEMNRTTSALRHHDQERPSASLEALVPAARELASSIEMHGEPGP